MVERALMVRKFVGSIFHGGTMIRPLIKQRTWYVLSCLWDGAYKRSLAANRKK